MDVAPGRKLGQAIDGLANAVIVTIQVRRGCSRQYSCRALARDRAVAKSPICIVLGFAVLFAHAAPFGATDAYGAECKMKIAGFYLEELDQTRPHKLSRGSENLPASLTGIAGNSEHGRDVFISAQKGGCVSCHQLSTLSPAIAQGSIGPTLDGAGTKYNEGQLRHVLLQPGAYFPETIMPSYYRAGDSQASVLTAAEIEDLVAYLGTLK